MSAYLVCLHTHQWCAADIYLAEAFPRCARSILLRCMALAAAQLLGSRCSHERQDTGAREDIGSTAKYGSCGRGGKCCGGRYLFAFFLIFFCFFVFWVPNRRPKPEKYRPINDLHCEPIRWVQDLTQAGPLAHQKLGVPALAYGETGSAKKTTCRIRKLLR